MPGIGKLVVGYEPRRPQRSPWRWRLGMTGALGLCFVGSWMWAGSWQTAVKLTISYALILLVVYLTRITPSGDRHLKP